MFQTPDKKDSEIREAPAPEGEGAEHPLAPVPEETPTAADAQAQPIRNPVQSPDSKPGEIDLTLHKKGDRSLRILNGIMAVTIITIAILGVAASGIAAILLVEIYGALSAYWLTAASILLMVPLFFIACFLFGSRFPKPTGKPRKMPQPLIWFGATLAGIPYAAGVCLVELAFIGVILYCLWQGCGSDLIWIRDALQCSHHFTGHGYGKTFYSAEPAEVEERIRRFQNETAPSRREDALLLSAFAYGQNKMHPQMESEFRKLIASTSDEPLKILALRGLADSLAKQDKYKEAEQVMLEAIRLVSARNPQVAEHPIKLIGNYYFRSVELTPANLMQDLKHIRNGENP